MLTLKDSNTMTFSNNSLNNLSINTSQTSDVQIISNNQSEILLYPNPNKGEFTLDKLYNFKGEILVQLTDLKGAILQTIQCQNSNLPMQFKSESLNGIFFLKVQTSSKLMLKKVMIY